MRKIVLFIFFLLQVIFTSAQDMPIPQVFTPNAAELGKYGDVPVDYFSGLPSISIPLTEIRARNYTLPIYLSYHASGNKPDQHPGWVGQGWSLHAGGCITRVVNGMKDETSSIEAYGHSNFANPGYIYHPEGQNESYWSSPTNIANETFGQYSKDYAPDEFHVTTDEINASFFFTSGGGVKIVSQANDYFSISYRISTNGSTKNLILYPNEIPDEAAPETSGGAYTYNYIEEIVLTATDGTVYRFGGDVSSIDFTVSLIPVFESGVLYRWKPVATANCWYLTAIERTDGEIVTLLYEKDGSPISYIDRHYSQQYYPPGQPYVFNTWNDQYKRNQVYTFLYPSYLKCIRCKDSTDSLTVSTVRTTELCYQYDRATLETRISELAKYDTLMVYDYYKRLGQIHTLRGDIVLTYTNDNSTRLKLLEVSFLDNGNIDRKYQMSYNSTPLPAYNSRKTNIWGDYALTQAYSISQMSNLDQIRSTVSPSLAQAEMLSTIEYPTGGRTEFDYEPHTFCKVAGQFPFIVRDTIQTLAGGLRIRKITSLSGNDILEEKEFEYKNAEGSSSGILSGIPRSFVNGNHYVNVHYGEWMGASYISFNEQYQASYSYSAEWILNTLSTTDGRHVTYSVVTEVRSGGGKAVYEYTNHDTGGLPCSDTRPLYVYENTDNRLFSTPYSSRQLFRGLLLRKTFLDTGGNICRKEEYQYRTDTTEYILSFDTEKFFGGTLFRSGVKKIYTSTPLLIRKIISEYPNIGSNPLVDTVKYEYDTYRNLTRETRRRGCSSEIKTEFKYPVDFSTTLYTDMVIAGKVGLPIERLKFNDDLLIEDELLIYKNFSGKILPWKHYLAPLGAGKSPQGWTYYSGDSVPPGYGTEDYEIVSRDVMGNPTTINERSGIQTIWTWDYFYVNPTGKTIKGVSSSAPSLTETYSWSANCSGLTGKVDARGVSESYSYDGLGRLIRITDSHGHIRRRFEYSYGLDASHVREISYNDVSRSDSTVTERRIDGLGREQQVVNYAYGLNGTDLSTWTEYDSCGRISKKWLPAATSTSVFPAFRTASNTSYNDTCAFEIFQYEDSPLDRQIKVVGAGNNWHSADKCVVTAYEAEYGGGLIRDCLHAIESGDSLILSYRNYSDIHPCSAERNEDEDGNVLITYTDMEGRVLLERRLLDPTSGNDPVLADTYYLYDTAGRLMMIVPPELSSRASTLTWFASYSQTGWKDVRDYAFQYRYDDYGRCIAKKLPGADWVYYAYDKGGYPIFSQDGNQRARGVWGFSLPDPLRRECLSGEAVRYMHNVAKAILRNNNIFTIRNNGDNLRYGYSVDEIMQLVSSLSILNVQYWDDHSFVGENFTSDGVMFGSSLFGPASLSGEPSADIFSNSKGLLTGLLSSPLGTLPDNTVTGWRKSVRYFNERGSASRKIDTYSSGHSIREATTYDFRELPTTRYRRLIVADTTALTEQYNYSYDKWARPLVTTHGLNGGQPVILSSNQYDALGRLSSVEHGGCDSLTTNYTYNVRGWTKSISSPYFTENLYYEAQRGTTSVPCWNGNISAVDWKAGANRFYDSAFDLYYDKMSRLTKALWEGSGSGRYNSRFFSYDLNSNIIELEREHGRQRPKRYHNQTVVTCTPDGNKMGACSSESVRLYERTQNPITSNGIIPTNRTVYGYDNNGNVSSGWTETRASELDPWVAGTPFFETHYNFMNLPKYRRLSSAEEWTVYDANGEKQAVYSYDSSNSTTRKLEYAGNLIFYNGSPNWLLTDGGHIELGGDAPNYQWWLTDHLGNVCVVADSLGTISQTNHYAPYGEDIWVHNFGNIPLPNTDDATENRYRYGGKEWNDTFSDYDFSARYFSTDYARFTSQDPLAEQTPYLSPYAYCVGNPMRYVDPTGMEGVKYEDGEGGYIIESNIVVLVEEKIPLTEGISEKEKKSTERKNKRIEQRNTNFVQTVQQSLESIFTKSYGENGEMVSFKFNIIPVSIGNPEVHKVSTSVRELSRKYGIPANTPNRQGFGEGVALAAIISQAPADYGSLGITKGGILVCLSSQEATTIGHEIGHTLHLTHPFGGAPYGLMHYPPESLSSNEISFILKNAFHKK